MLKKVLAAGLTLLSVSAFTHAEKPLKLYLDADFSRMVTSSESIELGVNTALDEVSHQVQGRNVEVVRMDHRGNPSRSKRNLKLFMKDPDALLVIAGLHSPPLLKNRAYINEQNILTLVPWAAAGPITRPTDGKSAIYRVSIDDSRAGTYLMNYAKNEKKCKTPHLLLEDTGWGRNNDKNMSAAANAKGYSPQTTYFKWGVTDADMRIMVRTIVKEHDCVLFVGNGIEGTKMYLAMASLPKEERRPIISHWGITGGNFWANVQAKTQETLDLSFIQTKFSFVSSPANALSRAAFGRANKLNPKLSGYDKLDAPTGFIHAYDLTRLMLAALKNVTLEDDMAANRVALANALDGLQGPVQGLVKTYTQPFASPAPNQHEALHPEDYRMGAYNESGAIYLLNP